MNNLRMEAITTNIILYRIGSTQGSFNQFGTIIQSIIRIIPEADSVFVMPRIFIRLIIVKLTRRRANN